MKNVVVCIKGLPYHQKDSLHKIVKSLGGQYTGELDLETVTHLIIKKTDEKGNRYHNALERSDIKLVDMRWLLESQKEGHFIPELDYLWQKQNNIYENDIHSSSQGEEQIVNSTNNLKNDNLAPSMICEDYASQEMCLNKPEYVCKRVMSEHSMNNIFSKYCFYIVVATPANNDRGFSIVSSQQPNSLWYEVGKFIRHGSGTHYWYINEAITHVIVVCHDLLDHETRNAILEIEKHHPNIPAILPFQWLIASFINESLEPYDSYELKAKKRQRTKPTDRMSHEAPARKRAKISVEANIETSFVSSASATKKSVIFQDCIFYIIPTHATSRAESSTDPFHFSTIEAEVISNGGHILSYSTIDAIKKIIQTASETASSTLLPHEKKRRFRCYLIHFTGIKRIEQSQLSKVPLLTIFKNTTNLDPIPITPVWITACIKESNKDDHPKKRKLPLPSKYPMLFQPQSWNTQRIINNKINLKVSLTGFLNMERTGVIQLLSFLNIPFTDTLQKSNTHLLYPKLQDEKKDRKSSIITSSKFICALEWKLNVVSIDWIYHVMQFSYTIGCEKEFLYCSDA